MLPILMIASAVAAQDVTLRTSDGQKLHALSEAADGSQKGVVLVHMLGREAADWRFLAEKLSRSGMQVVAPDLRGHGGSGERELVEADYAAMINDVTASVAWLRDRGVKEISCAGASIGANLCLQVAAADPEIVNVVLLSPGMNYKGVSIGGSIDGYGSRPLLIVASEDDRYAARSASVIDDRAKGQKHFALLEKAGHGTKMLNRDPSLEGLVMSWLLGTYQLASGDVVKPRPATAEDVGTVETTGEKLDSHK